MTITYPVKHGIYVNMTNRCPCACTFCLRQNGPGVYGSDPLWLEREPTVQEVCDSLDAWDLEQYEEELRMMPQSDPLAKILPQILEIAKELHQPEIFLGDLVQEGSMGLMIGLSQQIEAEEELIQMARENMQSLLEVQSEVKIQDQKMADKVNDLDEKIKEVTEQMGRKVSVEELSQLLEITEEEIEDIVRLAGEDLEEEKPAEP